MAREFRLPSIGDAHSEAEVIEWLVEVGDSITLDHPMVRVETAKAIVEIPAPFAGVVLARFGEEGEVISVGDPLIVIGEPGEVWSGDDEKANVDAQPAAELEATSVPPQSPEEGKSSEQEPDGARQPDDEAATPATAASRPQASPGVRKLARERGIDLAGILGSGPQGQITRADVLAVDPAAGEAGDTAPVADRERLSRLRRTIAENLTKSWREIPHVTLHQEAPAERLFEVRKRINEFAGRKISIDAMLLKLCVPALEKYPIFRAYLDGEEVVYRSAFDLGLAVATEEGLIVPVVRNVHDKGLGSLAADVESLVEAARARTVTPADLEGNVFTVSNVGAAGGQHLTSILPPMTSALLSVGRFADSTPAKLALSVTIDHRLIDGALAAQFLLELRALIAEPAVAQ